MYAGYRVLNALPAEAFLHWENFRTKFDWLANNKKTQAVQYEKGKQIGAASVYVSISANGTWGARGKDGSSTHSYEGIGYHACTADLLHGFLDSGVPIVVFRLYDRQEGPITETWIQGEKPVAEVGRH